MTGARRAALRSPIETLGATAMQVAREAGGITLLAGRVLRCLVPPSMDGRELTRNMYRMGNRSVPIVALTAFFVGGIMVIQAGMYVRQFNATGLVGWGAGYAIFREIGPVLIALMFSGRVGSNNTAELGTMTVTEQLDGLRALAIDPIRYLIVPRVVAMMVMLFILTVVGDLVSIAGGMLFSRLLIGIDPSTFYYSLVDNLDWIDFVHGLVKSAVFGLSIALTSCYFGVSVRGGAVGVGRAVNAAVVAAAVSIMLLDFFLTFLLP
ncbi:MAG TPA: ABC transporter permease [Kofleriaceae bacterium]|nr:ABC transporter permease [Kofleriaceae bacterium]